MIANNFMEAIGLLQGFTAAKCADGELTDAELEQMRGELEAIIDAIDCLNFADDRVMEQQLESVKRELLSKTAEEYRDSAVARARLKNGLSQLADQARNLARQDTTELVQRFGELGRRKFNLAA